MVPRPAACASPVRNADSQASARSPEAETPGMRPSSVLIRPAGDPGAYTLKF